jgi:thiosulfate/3-mercaptopyruvate sulfurtransferase
MGPALSKLVPADLDQPAQTVLVEPQWLASRLTRGDLRVIEVDVSPATYEQWHIDGAGLWNIYADLKDPDYRTVDPTALGALLARSGITPQTTVVFYGYAPAFGFWLMKMLGHSDARILNCSRDAWRAAGLPWTSARQHVPETTYQLGDADPGLRAVRTTVERAIGCHDTLLLDVRSAEEYRGERFWPSGGMEPGGRPGHIPSGVHLPIDGLFDADGSYRSVADCRRLFSAVDPDSLDEVITYCTIGGRAATAWFVLTHLLGRRNVRVYDGSWAEWGRCPDALVDTF